MFQVLPHLVGIWRCKSLLSTLESTHTHTALWQCCVPYNQNTNIVKSYEVRRVKSSFTIWLQAHLSLKRTNVSSIVVTCLFNVLVPVMSSFPCFVRLLCRPSSLSLYGNVPQRIKHVIDINAQGHEGRCGAQICCLIDWCCHKCHIMSHRISHFLFIYLYFFGRGFFFQIYCDSRCSLVKEIASCKGRVWSWPVNFKIFMELTLFLGSNVSF